MSGLSQIQGSAVAFDEEASITWSHRTCQYSETNQICKNITLSAVARIMLTIIANNERDGILQMLLINVRGGKVNKGATKKIAFKFENSTKTVSLI